MIEILFFLFPCLCSGSLNEDIQVPVSLQQKVHEGVTSHDVDGPDGFVECDGFDPEVTSSDT